MYKFTKLSTGAWGVRAEGESPSAGAIVTVRKRTGSSEVTLGELHFTGDAHTVWTIQTRAGRSGSRSYSRRSYSRRTGCPCGSREDEPAESDCFTCRLDNY